MRILNHHGLLTLITSTLVGLVATAACNANSDLSGGPDAFGGHSTQEISDIAIRYVEYRFTVVSGSLHVQAVRPLKNQEFALYGLPVFPPALWCNREPPPMALVTVDGDLDVSAGLPTWLRGSQRSRVGEIGVVFDLTKGQILAELLGTVAQVQATPTPEPAAWQVEPQPTPYGCDGGLEPAAVPPRQ